MIDETLKLWPQNVSCRGSLSGGGAESTYVWNANISTWQRHAQFWLDEAVRCKIPILCFQETQISSISAPAAINAAQQAGYHMWLCERPPNRKGGVAILVQQHLPSRCLFRTSNEGGQFLGVEISGCGGTSLVVATAYASSGETTLMPSINQWMSTLGRRPAILLGDFNELARQETIISSTAAFGFQICAQGGHTRSSKPIDFIFCKGIELAHGEIHPTVRAIDHDLLVLTLPQAPALPKPSLKFSPCSPIKQEIFDPLPVEICDFDTQSWLLALRHGNIDQAWMLWSNAAENALRVAGYLKIGIFRPRGSTPKVKHAEGRHGRGQSHLERQIRRCIRRCREAAVQVRLRGLPQMDQNLANQLIRDVSRLGGDPQLVYQGFWVELEKWFYSLLDSQLKTQQQVANNEWNKRMNSIPSATKWIKAKTPPAIMLATNGKVVAGPAAVVEDLCVWWKNFWDTTSQRNQQDLLAKLQSAWALSDRKATPQQMQPLSLKSFITSLRKISGKASGPDGWEAHLLLLLPEDHLLKLVSLLQEIERCGVWPESQVHWKVAFLPKKDGQLSAQNYRPISVGPVLYRAWAAARAQEFAGHFSTFFGPSQGGGRGTPDCATLVLQMKHVQKTQMHFAAALDLAKAFDSIHVTLAISVFKLHGLPDQLCNCLSNAWTRQVRHPVVQGCVSNQPIHCQVLPQGDPWSPWAMSLLIGSPGEPSSKGAVLPVSLP